MSEFDLFGFKRIETTEHEFARKLAKLKAIDNYQTIGRANVWYGPTGEAVAACIYDNQKMTCDYYLRA